MKTPILDRKYLLEEHFYSDGSPKSEKYMLHMAYISFYYSEDGTPIRLVINGREYPPTVELKFEGDELQIIAG